MRKRNNRFWLNNQSQFDHSNDGKRVWINKRGSDGSWLCWKICFDNRLGFLQSLKCSAEEDTKCSFLEKSSELGRFGSLIMAWRWRSFHRYEEDITGICPNMKCEIEIKLANKSQNFSKVFSSWDHKKSELKNNRLLIVIFPGVRTSFQK